MTFFCRILPGTSIALIFAALATKTNRCPKTKLLDDEDDNDVEFDDGDDDLDNDGGRIDYGDSSDDGEDRGLQVRCYFSVLSSELDGNLVVQLN